MAATPLPARYAVEAGDVPVHQVNTHDLRDALSRGFDDFMAMPSHLAFLFLIYPALGLFLAGAAFGYDVMPLVYPLVTGFALVGPLAAIGLYELSRRRERGQPVHWSDAFAVLKSPHLGSIVTMGVILVALFLLWILSARAIYGLTLGSLAPATFPDLVRDVLATPRGWALLVFGNLVGFAFAELALIISVIAFPMIIDRGVGVGTAIATSRRAVMQNPVNMSLWGLLVAACLVVGSLPLFVGLAVVLPVLGHATWHLYRKVVDG